MNVVDLLCVDDCSDNIGTICGCRRNDISEPDHRFTLLDGEYTAFLNSN